MVRDQGFFHLMAIGHPRALEFYCSADEWGKRTMGKVYPLTSSKTKHSTITIVWLARAGPMIPSWCSWGWGSGWPIPGQQFTQYGKGTPTCNGQLSLSNNKISDSPLSCSHVALFNSKLTLNISFRFHSPNSNPYWAASVATHTPLERWARQPRGHQGG